MESTQYKTRRRNKVERMRRVGDLAKGKFVSEKDVPEVLKRIIEPDDIVCIEGDNPKQADFLANQLATLDIKDLHDIHLVMSCITLPSHIELFKKGAVKQVDTCYAAPQDEEVAQLLADGKFPIGAIHTYNELYGRYYIDLTPRVALIAAVQADRAGNLFLGANTEDTPAVAEPTAFSNGIVFAQRSVGD